jgi:hypothetical protein
MIKSVAFGLIPGVMLGVEWDYDMGFFVIDLLIVRIVWDYVGFAIVESPSPPISSSQSFDSANPKDIAASPETSEPVQRKIDF